MIASLESRTSRSGLAEKPQIVSTHGANKFFSQGFVVDFLST
jgi:hypothetical protein